MLTGKGKVYQIIFTAALSFMIYTDIAAQGCSDAGLCTIDAFKPSAQDSEVPAYNRIEAGASVGGADYAITAFGGYLGYSRDLGESFTIDAKLTFLGQSGNDISVFGAGDIFTNITYKFSRTLSITGGLKIPLNKADKALNDLPLPMDYQSSLGSLDLLAGIKFNPERWQLALAAQIPLAQNENAFFPELYDPASPLYQIQATNAFNRSADILLHVSRTFDLTENFLLTPGLLPIYHLGNDKYTDIDGIESEIEGSEGLTLNFTLYAELKLKEASSLEFSVGFPFIVRDARPDGLTRSFVFGTAYKKRF